MDRDEALAYLQSIYNARMTAIGRDTDDSPEGYGPVLDRAFYIYIGSNGLDTTITTTTVAGADVYCFTVLLDALALDLIAPAVAATSVDFSVDAPLTNIKHSQAFRGIDKLRTDAWTKAGLCGYGPAYDNVAGIKVNLDFLEPGGGSGTEWG